MDSDKLLPEIRYDEAMLRLCGNINLYKKLLKKFNVMETVDKMVGLVKADRFAEAAAEAHALVGAAYNLALPLLALAARSFESVVLSGKPASGESEALERAAEAVSIKIGFLLKTCEADG